MTKRSFLLPVGRNSHWQRLGRAWRTAAVALGLLTCVVGRAQFAVGGVAPAFDQATSTYLVSLPEQAFGQPLETLVSLDADSLWTDLALDGLPVATAGAPGAWRVDSLSGATTCRLTALRNGQPVEARLAFTFLPVLQLSGTFGMSYASGSASLTMPGQSHPEVMPLRAKWRGGTTNCEGRHKRNYHLKFTDADGKKQNRNFFGLRNDNSWLLDAGQIDMLRVRNHVAAQLWNDFARKPYYADREPQALSAVRGSMVEVFLNNTYQGLYAMSEAMDRKQLRLRKYDDTTATLHGQLWKSKGWGVAMMWQAPDYDNASPTWDVIETKYPDLSDVSPTDYSVLWQAIDLVAHGSDEAFCQEVGQRFDLPVLQDYLIFVEALWAIDNAGKNLYWAVYDREQSPMLTLAVWDLDATLGQYVDDEGERPAVVAPDLDYLETFPGFNLFRRLVRLNPDGFNEALCQRYRALRQGPLDTDSLVSRYASLVGRLVDSGAAAREEARWSGDSDMGGHTLHLASELDYLSHWIRTHMLHLDQLMESPTEGIDVLFPASPHHREKAATGVTDLGGRRVANETHALRQGLLPRGVYVVDGQKTLAGGRR